MARRRDPATRGSMPARPSGREKPTAPPDWWKEFFGGLMADFWRAAIPDAQTRKEADFLETALALSPGARVLDVPCGHGRHSLELARRGHRVTGVDFSEDLLASARESAARAALDVAWEKRDMRALPWTGAFDAAFCAGNSFGFFDDDGNLEFLEGVARALRRGGKFLLESGWIAESLFADFRERLDIAAGGIQFVAINRYDPVTGFVENEFRARAGRRRESKAARHRVYTCSELHRLVERAGLSPVAAWGTLDRRPYAVGSPRLLLSAVRR
jgi:SAM-dependent methyltransferase